MSADPELEYLTTSQIAELMGIKPKSVRMALWRGLMPEPDMILFGNNLWLRDTIEKWLKTRGKKRKRKRTRGARLHAAPRRTSLPRNARLSTIGRDPVKPLVQTTVSAEVAAKISGELRAEGHHCVIRDVQELAVADPDSLDYDRRMLQQRVARKLRGLKRRS